MSNSKFRVRDTSSVFQVGQTVMDGAYRVTKNIAAMGGMSNVYLVEDTTLGKEWILKQILDPSHFEGRVPPSDLRKAQLDYRALHQEAQIMKGLSHPGIPRITSIKNDKVNRSSYIIMDYVDGKSALRMLQNYSVIEESTAVRWALQLCSILAYLHNKSNPIVYRDLKPANIMIGTNNSVNLIDFGTAEIITPDNEYPKEALGTKGYAAYEQRTKKNKLTTRSDIFGLGATLYTLLTGMEPNQLEKVKDDKGNVLYDENGKELVKRIQPEYGPYSIRKVDPRLSKGLEEVVRRCTEPDLVNRYESIEEVITALSSYELLDVDFRKTMQRKVNTSRGFLALGGLLCLGAVIPWMLGVNSEDNAYVNAVEVANQSGRTEDFLAAIDLKPDRLDPYPGLIESIKQDGQFTSDEERQLLGALNPELTELKKSDKYPEVAYDIGNLYWFYYSADGSRESEGRVQSTKWFKDAVDGGYTEGGLAKVYYSIGEFDKTISTAQQESNDSGLYKKYWADLSQLNMGENGEVVDLRILLAYMNCINNYSHRLNTDGVPRADVEAKVLEIKNYLSSNKPSPGVATDLYKQLEEGSVDLDSKVSIAYDPVGGAE